MAATTHSPYSVPVPAAEQPSSSAPPSVHCPYAVDAPAHTGQKRPHQSRRSKDGKGRRGNNKAAKEAPARPMPVCLDHLKGICTLKRLKCKFSHPPLDGGRSYADLAREAEAAQQAYSSASAYAASYAGPHHGGAPQQPPAYFPPPKVCEVYQLTGFCKFGQACRDYHPPQGPATPPPPCAPAISNKMSEHCREAAESAAATLHPQLRGEKAARRAARDLAALLGSLPSRPAGEGSDEALRFVISALRPSLQPGAAAGASLLTPAQVAATLHARAVEVPHESDLHTLSQLASAAAHHCPAAAAPLASSLLDLCTRLVYQADDLLAAVDPATATLVGGAAGEEQPNSLRRAVDEKKAANLRFLGALASDGVVAPAEAFAVLEFLLQRGSAGPSAFPSDAPTHCLLAGQLLRFAGPLLARSDPPAFGRLAGWFIAASARHTPEVALAAEETTAFLRWSGALPQPQQQQQQQPQPFGGCSPVPCLLGDSARSLSSLSASSGDGDSLLLESSASSSAASIEEGASRSSTPSSTGPDLSDSDGGSSSPAATSRRERFSI